MACKVRPPQQVAGILSGGEWQKLLGMGVSFARNLELEPLAFNITCTLTMVITSKPATHAVLDVAPQHILSSHRQIVPTPRRHGCGFGIPWNG